jgi:uncharacterized protein involved in exopolysaccharide biosynthesis
VQRSVDTTVSDDPDRREGGLAGALRSKVDGPPTDLGESRRRLGGIWRHKWLLIQAVVLVPAVAVAFSLAHDHVYRASAQVWLRSQTRAEADAEVRMATERPFLRSVVAGDPRLAGDDFARRVRVGVARTNLLVFSVDAASRAEASRLATLWAYRYYLRRRRDLARTLTARLGKIRAAERAASRRGGRRKVPAALLSQAASVRRELADPNAAPVLVLRSAHGADLLRPRPLRAGLLGLLLGVILGLILALIAEGSRRAQPSEEQEAT